MNTVEKGNLFEARCFKVLSIAVANNRFGLDKNCCRIYRQRGYYSKDREGNIIFDLSIEIWPQGADRCHILYLCECKDYKGTVPVSDIEEFLSKIEQVGGCFVKGVFITTGEVQQSALKLLQNKGFMLIKIDADDYANIVLYNQTRNKEIQTDRPVTDFEQARKLVELNTILTNNSLSTIDWDKIIENLLINTLNHNINLESSERTEGLGYLSKKLLSELAVKIIDEFDYCIIKHGKPLPLERFIAYLNETHGLKFVTDKPFNKGREALNGYYDRRKKIIHINPILHDTGLFAFVVAHEIAHFFLHENLKISQAQYETSSASKYDSDTRKRIFEKDTDWIEWQANYLAGCLLMPHRSLLWQLICWQEKRGISRRGYIWVDNQPCNILDFKVAITQLAFVFGVSRSVLEIRMRDLEMISYQKNVGYNSYTLFGNNPYREYGYSLVGSLLRYSYDSAQQY